MKPRIKLAETSTPKGDTMALYEHDGAYALSLGGQELMHSRASASERQLGDLGIGRLNPANPARILIGGLGLGFTLKRVLKSVGPQTRVEVWEWVPDVIHWNRTHLRHLHGPLLDDPRLDLRIGSVIGPIREAERASYAAVLLDIDNGPMPMVSRDNAATYTRAGLASIYKSIADGGRAVFWSARPDDAFEARLKRTGFKTRAIPAKKYEAAKRPAYTLYVGDK